MNEQYLSHSMLRVLRCISAMAGHEAHGVTPGELAKQLEESASNITRLLANLEHLQFAERCPWDAGRWRLSKAMVQIANTVALNFSAAQRQFAQDQQHYQLVR